MPLKYVITSMEHDPQVLNDAARGNLPEEKMLGITPNPGITYMGPHEERF